MTRLTRPSRRRRMSAKGAPCSSGCPTSPAAPRRPRSRRRRRRGRACVPPGTRSISPGFSIARTINNLDRDPGFAGSDTERQWAAGHSRPGRPPFIVSPHRLTASGGVGSLPVKVAACLSGVMNSAIMRGLRRSLVLAATGIVMAGTTSGAAAQAPPGAVVQPFDSGARLRGYLSTLADNPQSLEALIGAGRAALEMGDANAALTFFGRADEVAPRHARVKAGMGSVLVQLGQPQAALSLFAEAVALGAPEVEIAADRGLAYDLMGYTQREQQEYVAAMRRRDAPERRRRLPASPAISR